MPLIQSWKLDMEMINDKLELKIHQPKETIDILSCILHVHVVSCEHSAIHQSIKGPLQNSTAGRRRFFCSTTVEQKKPPVTAGGRRATGG